MVDDKMVCCAFIFCVIQSNALHEGIFRHLKTEVYVALTESLSQFIRLSTETLSPAACGHMSVISESDQYSHCCNWGFYLNKGQVCLESRVLGIFKSVF